MMAVVKHKTKHTITDASGTSSTHYHTIFCQETLLSFRTILDRMIKYDFQDFLSFVNHIFERIEA
jgi:hypothetical protein